MATFYIFTDQGWLNKDVVLTPETWKIKKNAKALPVKVTEDVTQKLKTELPMVFTRRGYYCIHSVI